MKSKILLGLGVLAVTLAVLPMFAAFEAHVINVTAQIENALDVQTDAINFGTVFPQEHLNMPLWVALSSSFLAEDRVDDVEYIIRQKPKCAITSNNGQSFDPENTATGHIVATSTDPGYLIDCGNPPRQLNTDESWGVLPSLCEYISKEPDNRPEPGNDGTTPSFHQPWTWDSASSTVVWNDTIGYLSENDQDTIDNWIVDLSVPCFGGFCAQDWEDWVHSINPQADPDQYTQPISNEHKVFGCDLWIEVTGVSENEPQL